MVHSLPNIPNNLNNHKGYEYLSIDVVSMHNNTFELDEESDTFVLYKVLIIILLDNNVTVSPLHMRVEWCQRGRLAGSVEIDDANLAIE